MKFEDIADMDPDTEIETLQAMEEEPEVEGAEVEEEVAAAEPEVDHSKELEDLRAERQKLQSQLQELSVSTLADRRRLEALEKTLAQAQKAEDSPREEGPSAEDVVNYLDEQIAKVDAALTKAETADPSKVPALRQQLRVLERYYNNYVSQAMLEASRGPDPESVVSQAVQEATTHGNFQALKQNITREFPILDTKSPYFNEGLRDQVHDIYNPMIQAGGDPVESLAKATMLVMRANGIKSISELSQEQQEPGSKKEEATKARKASAVEKNIKAAKNTPPDISHVGKGSAELGPGKVPDFDKMGINDFMRMTDSQIEEMEKALMMYGE